MVAPSFFEKVAPVYEFLTRMFMLAHLKVPVTVC